MLEKEAVLRTWRLDRPPTQPGPIAAQAVADHRLAYLDYEGPVSGGRGTVQAFDRGEYSLLTDDRLIIEVKLQGDMLRGRATLKHLPDSGRSEFTFCPTPEGHSPPP